MSDIDENSVIPSENMDKAATDNVSSTSMTAYNNLMRRYIRALGSPPRFTKEVDPYYSNDIGAFTGRAIAQTWFSHPSIFSICPGTVDYLPGFSSAEKDTLFNKLKDSYKENSIAGQILSKVSDVDKLSGKLYAFKSAYKDYMNVVNLLARTAADYLGIGKVDDVIYGSKTPLNQFDYGYFTTPWKSEKSKSLFDETKKALSSAVSDDSYIHFFLNNQGSSVSENINTSATASILQEKLEEGGTLSEVGRNIEFLFGGAIGSSASADIESILKEATSQNSFLGAFANSMNNYIGKGGRLVFPQMIDNVDYAKSITVSMKFTSVYGDRRSIFLRTILPALFLLAISAPKQLSDNMYTYPFLCRVYQQGWYNSDLSFISGLELTRGGQDNTSWTTDGLPTEIDATFNVTPLYSSLMVSSAANPFLFMQNTTLMEYLGTLCGLDLKMNNFWTKVNMAVNALSNRVLDLPTNAARGIVDTKITRAIRDFVQITN